MFAEHLNVSFQCFVIDYYVVIAHSILKRMLYVFSLTNPHCEIKYILLIIQLPIKIILLEVLVITIILIVIRRRRTK